MSIKKNAVLHANRDLLLDLLYYSNPKRKHPDLVYTKYKLMVEGLL